MRISPSVLGGAISGALIGAWWGPCGLLPGALLGSAAGALLDRWRR